MSRSSMKLSKKEYSKITASLRRARHEFNVHDDDQHFEQSFIQEDSFMQAPLNSRLDASIGPTASPSLPIANMPQHVQQAVILNDLLFVLTGIQGEYITYHPDYSPEDDDPLRGIQFVCHPDLDPSLADLVKRILPLATYYTAVDAFVQARSHLEFGLVNHALCASIRDIIKDYQTLLTQLESAFLSTPLTLQKLFFHIQPTLQSFSHLYTLLITIAIPPSSPSSSPSQSDDEEDEDEEEKAKNALLGIHSASALKHILKKQNGTEESSKNDPPKGGELLATLTEWRDRHAGNPAAARLFGRLLRDAAKPYVSMLKVWVTKGTLDDPHGEFCVKESKGISRGTMESDYMDEYWERRYTLRDGPTSSRPTALNENPVPAAPATAPAKNCVPPQLERWKHKILLAGKYLNVIRECGIDVGDINHTWTDEDVIDLDNERLQECLHTSYTHANTSLLLLLIRTHHLLPRLRSLKRLFFLSQSSWLGHLLDLAAGELKKSVRGASKGRIQSLLEVCLREAGLTGYGISGSSMVMTTSISTGSLTPSLGDEGMFKEDVRVTMATSGLYDWLLKIISVSGVIGPEEGATELNDHKEKDREKEKDEKDKKPMLAIDALTLDYIVPFPLSLILSRKTILRYQLIFRFLLHLKHVEQSLCAMFVEHQQPVWRARVHAAAAATAPRPPTRPPSSAATSRPPSAAAVSNPHLPSTPSSILSPTGQMFNTWRLRVFLLRARMLSWVQSILAFATFEVLEPNWRKLEGKLAKLEAESIANAGAKDKPSTGGKLELGRATVDEVMKEHVDFLDTCLKECMLTSRKLLWAYSKLIVTCSMFAIYSSSFTKSCSQTIASLESDSSGKGANDIIAKQWEILKKFETNFNHWFKVHLDCVQFYASSENVSLLPLVVRLNAVKVSTPTPS